MKSDVRATERRPLVWLAEVPFKGHPHRQLHLARYLSQRFDLLYVEPPSPLTPPALHLSIHSGVKVAQVAPLVNARPPLIRWVVASPTARRLASWLAALQLRRVIRAAFSSAQQDQLIVVCSTVFLCQAAIAMSPRLLVADICDDPRHFPGEPPWTAELLHTTISQAKLVTTSSISLQAEFRALGARHVELVSNGVHATYLDHDAETSTPPVGAPVGFIGYLGPWIDFDLLQDLAHALPELRFDLIGPVDPSVAERAAVLARFPNVRLGGPIPESAVPLALSTFSVGLIPFMRGPYTRAVNPNKLYEYAARNLPIVTTPFSPDVAQFGPDVDVCETTQEFVSTLRDRVNGLGRRNTRWIAETHTWGAVADQLCDLIELALGEVGVSF